ncbi:Trypsin [compost metagenome]
MNLLKLVIAIQIMAIVVACSDQSQVLSPRQSTGVIAGDKAQQDSLISHATVILNIKGGKFCTGVLLNDHVVLTAAHCVRNRTVLTVHNPAVLKSCFVSAVTEMAIAPQLPGKNFPSDLALLKLAKSVCTPPPAVLDANTETSMILTSTGYGEGTTPSTPDTFDMTVTSSDKINLRELFLSGYEDNKKVQADWDFFEENLPEFSDSYLFAVANNPQQSACMGDSGGPIFREIAGVLHIHGVVGGAFPHSAKGVARCEQSYMQFFAPVAPYLPWLTEKLQSW